MSSTSETGPLQLGTCDTTFQNVAGGQAQDRRPHFQGRDWKGGGGDGSPEVWCREAHWDAPGLDSHAGGSVGLATLPRGSTGGALAGAPCQGWVPEALGPLILQNWDRERHPPGLCVVV